ncbi:MAG: hypothetical protein ACK4PH_12535 [Aquincola tertiaricarbonis]
MRLRTQAAALAALLACALAGTAPAHGRHVEAAAHADYTDGQGQARSALVSNRVMAMLAAPSARVRFFTDASFSRVAGSVGLNQRIYLQAEAPSCNTSSGADAVQLQLFSQGLQRGGPIEAMETASGSGVFRGWTDGSAVMVDDTLSATLQGCSVQAEARTLVEPAGIVFDSEADSPLGGVRVRLIDVDGVGNGGQPGAPAQVLAHDGVSPAPSETTTAPDGRFSFPQVVPGRYALQLQAAAHSYPAKADAAAASRRRLHAQASYGAVFEVQADGMTPLVDVPLDPLPRVLRVQLSASRAVAEVAESVVYTATVRNAGDAPLDGVRLQARLPTGFAYVPGSLRASGVSATPPEPGPGPLLQWPLGAMAPGSSQTFTYRALIGALALQGDGRHALQATAEQPGPTRSNTARVRVEVQPSVFTDQAMVLGRVFADCNANGLADDGEPGVPGVRLVLQDGTRVSTDGAGRYSLYGLRARTQVLKIDRTSLPAGTQPLATEARHAGDGGSRFLDPRPGELQRADFPLSGCSPALQPVLATRLAAQHAADELDAALRSELTPDGQPRAPVDRRALPAAGVVGLGAVAPEALAPVTAAQPAVAARAPLDDDIPAQADADTLQALAERLDPAPGFIELRAGALLALQVNGVPVPEQRIGERVLHAARAIELREYVGVQLQPGTNQLLLTETDAFGNERARQSLVVRAPGAPARLQLEAPAGALRADGGLLPLALSVLDAEGLTVSGRHAVTLQASHGHWALADLDAATPGVQAFIDGGQATLALQAPAEAGEAELLVQIGGLQQRLRLPFVPTLRPLLAVGLVEGTLDLRRLGAGALRPASADDGFAQALQAQAADERSGGRAALYLKGQVRGDALLTLAYDSDKRSQERLFRDIQPDAFYPVYGDASVKGFDAQSTGALYVKLERGGSSVLYGDFNTQPMQQPARQLAAYQRSLTGLRLQHEQGALRGSAFASRDNARQQVIELRGNGTSGPYALRLAGLPRANGEQLEVLVRDRHQPSLVLRRTPLQRFVDYDFDAFGATVLLRTPLPSLDADLNPLFLRVTLEVEQGGPAFTVAGVEARLAVGEQALVGGTVVRDWNPLAPFQMAGLHGSVGLGPNTQLLAEAARTRSQADDIGLGLPTGQDTANDGRRSGDAARLELQHQGPQLQLRAHVGLSQQGFDNASATLSAGRSEAGVKAAWALDARTRLLAELLHTADASSDAQRHGMLAGIERSLDHQMKLEVGARHVEARGAAMTGDGTAPQDTRTQTVRAKLSGALPVLAGATAFLEAEQDVHDARRRLLAVGGDLALPHQARLYARHELVSSLTGPYALDATQRRHSTLLGIDAPAGGEGRGFGEYRARDALSGREAEAAIGLRNRWPLAEGLRLDTSLERVHPLAGGGTPAAASPASTAATAATAAVAYTASPLWKGTARLEWRRAAGGDGLLGSLGLARKLSQDWTLLGRLVHAQSERGAEAGSAPPQRLQQRLQLGAAYRQTGARPLDALARYEFKREQGLAAGSLPATDPAVAGPAAQPSAERSAHSLSVHAARQLSRDWVLSGHYAAKHAQEQVDGRRLQANAQRIGGRVSWSFAPRWDASLAGSMLGDARLNQRATAVGGELGWQLQDNLWLSVGHNLRGFHDRDLSGADTTRRGSYLKLRFKFDERLLAAGES